MNEFYWELIQFDGTVLEIPPKHVGVIKRRLEQKQPINTRSMMIPANQVKQFRKTSKLFNPQPLLEAASQAFKEPLYSEDGAIQSKWVKRAVTQREYARSYAQVPSYKRLPDENGMAMMAYRLPVHQIDPESVTECSEEEVQKLQPAK